MTSYSRSQPRPHRFLPWVCSVAVVILVSATFAVFADAAAAASVPGKPRITAIRAGNHSIRVSFAGPARTGGARIIGYRATCKSSDGGVTRSHREERSPIRVSRLTAGKTYTCRVAARNRVGYGRPSAPSAPVVVLPNPPPSVPGAPTITSVAAGVERLKVAFSPPASDGGARISGYRATCTSSDGGVTRSNGRSRSPITVSHLTASKTYTCTVSARNRVGRGPASTPSDAVVVLAPPVINSPGAPTITSAVAGRHRIRLTYSPPASDGGAPITAYRATCISSNGGQTRSVQDETSPTNVGKLTGGKTYTCTVAARNRRGFGPQSEPSAPVVVGS
jgi:hypothetical protein